MQPEKRLSEGGDSSLIEQYRELEIEHEFRVLRKALGAKNWIQMAKALGVTRQAVSFAKMSGAIPPEWFEKAGLTEFANSKRESKKAKTSTRQKQMLKTKTEIRIESAAAKRANELEFALKGLSTATRTAARAIIALRRALGDGGRNGKF